MNHYTYRAEWSAEHGEYVGRCIDHEPPAPITERKFSGKFVVRTSPALHARLAVEAAEQNVSLNQWDGAIALGELGPATNRPLRPLISHTHRFRKKNAPQVTVLL